MPVQAADLGSDGVADLEERIAELEATTARKGNRKVSLTISGYVNEQIQWWDDGVEQNVYQGTNESDQTRFRFIGKAKIDKDWSAGYIIELGIKGASQGGYTQDNDDGGTSGISVRHSAWYLESKTFGKLTTGQTSAANDSITELTLAKTITVDKPIQIFTPNAGFFLRLSDGTVADVTWGNLSRGIEPGEGDRYNVVRYDTPEFGGFTASASWGEDDLWAVALRYAGEFHGFKLAGGIGYSEVTDNSQGLGPNPNPGEGNEWGGSVSVLHEESGLFATFAYGEAEPVITTAGADNQFRNWNIQAGIQRKWNPLGKTTVYGEYFEGEFGKSSDTNPASPDPLPAGYTNVNIASSEVTVWGAAAIQSIDAAALDLYIAYRHYEADVNGLPAGLSVQDFDTVFSGAKISF
jgi:predicted porin